VEGLSPAPHKIASSQPNENHIKGTIKGKKGGVIQVGTRGEITGLVDNEKRVDRAGKVRCRREK